MDEEEVDGDLALSGFLLAGAVLPRGYKFTSRWRSRSSSSTREVRKE